jgi:hypothetical protein
MSYILVHQKIHHLPSQHARPAAREEPRNKAQSTSDTSEIVAWRRLDRLKALEQCQTFAKPRIRQET